KGIRVYKINLVYMASIKWVVELPFNARLLSSTRAQELNPTVIVAWNAKFFENSLITQEASGSLEDLEVIQDKHTHPSENTSLHHDVDEQEIVEPQSDVNPVCRSIRTHRAPNRMCLYVDAEEHELGNDIEPNNYKVALSDHESEKWLDAMNMEISQGASIPNEVKRMQRVPYASAVGSIMYAKIPKYLKNTKDIFIVYGGYMMDVDDSKSQTGYVFILNGGAVDWKSTKQSITATSSTKVEYMAASEASKEAVWIRKFISELGVVSTNEEPMKIYCDNTRAISIANESGITKGAKHYHTKVDYLREVIKLDDIKLDKAHTYDNVADPFTKASPFNKHSEHTMSIGLLPASSLM
ncbi:hypothetical protein Tco_1415352, partial [Tanacetum coccineum]